jgi:hypothetical protein
MGVEISSTFGAEQVGHAYRGQAQHQLEVAILAFLAGLSDASESQYVEGLAFIVDIVDYHVRFSSLSTR